MENQHEAELERQRKLMHAFIDNSPSVFFIKDVAGIYILTNRLYEKLFHLPPQGAVGKTDHDIFPASVAEQVRANDKIVAETGEIEDSFNLIKDIEQERRVEGKRIEFRNIDNGRVFPAWGSFSIIEYEGKFHLLCGIVDVSELERAREAAEQANLAKSVFLANMSHEVRTPINAVMGITDLALRTDLNPKLRDYLKKISASSKSLLRIVNDILDLSKIEAGQMDLESVPFDLRNVIENICDVVCASDACTDLEFLVSINKNVPCRLIGDPLGLEQVLTNLANNAVKFTPGGEVVIKAELVETVQGRVTLRFSIRDTGIGIPNEGSCRRRQCNVAGNTS